MLDIKEGFWYLRTDYAPFYTIVEVTRFSFGPWKDKLGVWSLDHEGNHWIEDYEQDQFIGIVPAP